MLDTGLTPVQLHRSCKTWSIQLPAQLGDVLGRADLYPQPGRPDLPEQPRHGHPQR